MTSYPFACKYDSRLYNLCIVILVGADIQKPHRGNLHQQPFQHVAESDFLFLECHWLKIDVHFSPVLCRVDVFAGPVQLSPGSLPLSTTGLPVDTTKATTTTSPLLITYSVKDLLGRVAQVQRKVFVVDPCPVPEFTCASSRNCSVLGSCDLASGLSLGGLSGSGEAAGWGGGAQGSPLCVLSFPVHGGALT